MAASLPFGRRPSSSFAPDFPAGADPRLTAAHAYAPHHSHTYPLQSSDLASNYQYTTARAAFDHSLAFDGASGSNVPTWFYNASQQPPSQVNAPPALPYHIDSYAAPQHAPAAVPISMAGPSVPSINAPPHHHRDAASVPPTVDFPSESAHIGSTDAAPFTVGTSGRVAAPAIAGAALPLPASISPSTVDRRASDESGHMVASGGPSAQNIAPSASESAGFHGSVSPNSSASLSNSPPDIAVAQPFHPYASAPVPPLAGMLVGEPITASMMQSIDAWLAPAQPASHNSASSSAAAAPATAKAPTVSARKISPVESSAASDAPSSARASGGATFHPGSAISTSSTLGSGPFKTSTERRERNKASQRESRKRKQDRLETLETENAALRKALADTKKYSHALSNGAGIRGQDGAEVAPIHLTKFTGAFHLDLIETHLEDDSVEAEWKTMIGRRFPGRASQEEDGDGNIPGAGSSTSDSDEDDGTQDRRDSTGAGSAHSTAPVKSEGAATDREGAESSQTPSQKAKKAMWEISLNQKRQKAAQNFPSMVAVPELVLYRVCRLYFSTLLPFTTKLKSGIINLRAAREAPGFIGEHDDLPRFPGDPAFGASELYLPKNLMPTEMQLRIGFHPVEIAVIPYPAMRDRLLTILSAFSALDELVREEEDAARFSEERGNDGAKAQEQDAPADDVNAELTDADIRKRTALLADMSAWKPKDFAGAVVMPDRARVYSYGFLEKPRGSHRLRKPAQRWLDEFFYEIVQTLRVWSPAGDVFDGECFEFKESFFRKYPYMVDGEILKATNRWRRARGEDPLRL